jgi:hypothetical protein|tara:strand:- start:167 stop:883 length:717 start_codon:yes stop_codon:yes gene_type:complete
LEIFFSTVSAQLSKIMFRKHTCTKTDDDSAILSAPLELRGVAEEEDDHQGSGRRVRKVIHDLGSRVHATFTFTSRGMMDSMESESDWTEDFRVRRRRFSGDCSSEKAFAIDVSIPSNPFFRYYCEIDEMQFETMKQKQNLSVNLNGFYLAFKESLVSCKTRESANVMVFTMNGTDGMGTLACLEDLGHKHVETLRIDFVPYTEREIQERVQLEYREMAKTLYGEEEEYAAPFAAPRRR